jgi:hypothetical protein
MKIFITWEIAFNMFSNDTSFLGTPVPNFQKKPIIFSCLPLLVPFFVVRLFRCISILYTPVPNFRNRKKINYFSRDCLCKRPFQFTIFFYCSPFWRNAPLYKVLDNPVSDNETEESRLFSRVVCLGGIFLYLSFELMNAFSNLAAE